MANTAAAIVLAVFRPLVRSSQLRYGSLETRGTPSILVGIAAIVLAAGTSRALQRATTALPESLREARLFWLSVRTARGELPPAP